MNMSRGRATGIAGAAALAAAAVTALPASAAATPGLPKVSDYHSLLVAPANPKVLLLGTHDGLYRSDDGGETWKMSALRGEDVMNLARTGRTIFTGGHDVFGSSSDGGKNWRTWRPKGLPSLDVHGLAADPRNDNLYAQISGKGLFRSTDSGRSFKLFSSDVNGMMMPIAITPKGIFVVGDMERGVFVSTNGRRWFNTAKGMVMGLAVNAAGTRIIATSAGIVVSTDGTDWKTAIQSKVTFGPVAWTPSRPAEAYAVGTDRSLWRSENSGKSWTRIV